MECLQEPREGIFGSFWGKISFKSYVIINQSQKWKWKNLTFSSPLHGGGRGVSLTAFSVFFDDFPKGFSCYPHSTHQSHIDTPAKIVWFTNITSRASCGLSGTAAAASRWRPTRTFSLKMQPRNQFRRGWLTPTRCNIWLIGFISFSRILLPRNKLAKLGDATPIWNYQSLTDPLTHPLTDRGRWC